MCFLFFFSFFVSFFFFFLNFLTYPKCLAISAGLQREYIQKEYTHNNFYVDKQKNQYCHETIPKEQECCCRVRCLIRVGS